MNRRLFLVIAMVLVMSAGRICLADFLSDLARPHDGRSMRATSTHKVGPDGKFDPNGEPDLQGFQGL